MTERGRKICETLGWVIFLGSAVCYTWASVRAGDLLSGAGGVLFFVACLLFLAPNLPKWRMWSRRR